MLYTRLAYIMNLSKCPTVLFTRIGLSWLSFFNHITVPQLPEILFHPPTHSLSFTYEMMIETKLFAQLILLSIYSAAVLFKYGRHPRPINQRIRKPPKECLRNQRTVQWWWWSNPKEFSSFLAFNEIMSSSLLRMIFSLAIIAFNGSFAWINYRTRFLHALNSSFFLIESIPPWLNGGRESGKFMAKC